MATTEAGSAPEGFERVGRDEDFREGRPRCVRVAGVPVAVFRIGDRIYALKDACPHMGAALSEGDVVGSTVVCHWHGWTFRLDSGHLTEGRAGRHAKAYEVHRAHGDVWLRPREDAAPAAADDADDWIPFDPDKHLKKRDGEGT